MVTGVDDNRPAGQTFADIIVGLTVKIQYQAVREKCAEALPGGALKLVDRTRNTRLAQAEAHVFATQMATDAAMKIVDGRGMCNPQFRLLKELFDFRAA